MWYTCSRCIANENVTLSDRRWWTFSREPHPVTRERGADRGCESRAHYEEEVKPRGEAEERTAKKKQWEEI